jgi:hypothetical protein
MRCDTSATTEYSNHGYIGHTIITGIVVRVVTKIMKVIKTQ